MQLCIALDLEEKSKNLALLATLKGLDIWVKVGLRSYIRDGVSFIKEIKTIDTNFKIFLDLKLYDIPNTMADAAFECAKIGIDMLTLHTSSGKVAMQSVMERLSACPKRPLVFGVSALTSFDSEGFEAIYNAPLEKHATFLATLGYQSGIDGAVCSVYESQAIKQATHPGFLTLTPAIRPFNEDKNDQKRTADLTQAKNALADFIVIGRPIYQSKDPLSVVKKILHTIEATHHMQGPTA
ncbi:orotidine-5'-phosphate decarboxylase [Helicobacter sp. 11S02596-1]|uniref:orotidine-5'-phosphate decarboxylase n=1 Tax=Helicobacter sp. 11S02596-1 TaxID=1476194 RepID=UPI000BA68DA2|nr:orotidine-5'-phosphate decarboxylase [Helicobacter sp. 11S02596-1]PAF42460.1 orotidine 5'-phosphate decarboxylase [Helicobacter sp. 11S02596-1]